MCCSAWGRKASDMTERLTTKRTLPGTRARCEHMRASWNTVSAPGPIYFDSKIGNVFGYQKMHVIRNFGYWRLSGIKRCCWLNSSVVCEAEHNAPVTAIEHLF